MPELKVVYYHYLISWDLVCSKRLWSVSSSPSLHSALSCLRIRHQLLTRWRQTLLSRLGSFVVCTCHRQVVVSEASNSGSFLAHVPCPECRQTCHSQEGFTEGSFPLGMVRRAHQTKSILQTQALSLAPSAPLRLSHRKCDKYRMLVARWRTASRCPASCSTILTSAEASLSCPAS